jgi:hypothetical protein
MNLRSATYVTAREVRNSILNNKDRFKDKDNVITNISVDLKPDFDFLNDNEFDPILGADYDAANDFIDVD